MSPFSDFPNPKGKHAVARPIRILLSRAVPQPQTDRGILTWKVVNWKDRSVKGSQDDSRLNWEALREGRLVCPLGTILDPEWVRVFRCSQDQPRVPSNCTRYSVGDCPRIFLNTRLKCVKDWNPTSKAISLTRRL